jgi:hypothetical protein
MQFSLTLRNNPSTAQTPSVELSVPAAPTSDKAATAEAQIPARLGVQVTLSSQAKAVNKDADIDASNLPTVVKDQLKMIRRIQEQITKKMDELQAVAKDPSLSPKAREIKTRQLQMELTVLNQSLMSATREMNKTMSDMKLPAEQVTKAAGLIGFGHA